MNARLPPPTPSRAKLRAEDFWLLARSGAFDGYAKSELIEGEIWVMSAIHSLHARAVAYLTTELTLALRQLCSELVVFTSGSVDLSSDSVPEPDISIGEDHRGDGGLPLAKLRLAVEISDTSLDIDLGRKATLYARHGVPEYWVVAREGACLYRHYRPRETDYGEREQLRLGEPIRAVTIANLVVETTGLH